MKCKCKKEDAAVIRIGNDIEIKWEVFTGPMGLDPVSFDGKNVTVYVKSKYITHEVQDVKITENSLNFFFYGKDQLFAGVHSIELVVNDGEKGMLTIDECNAFELVKHTCQTDSDADNRRISVNTITIKTLVEIDTDARFEIDNDMNLILTVNRTNDDIESNIVVNKEGELTLY